MLQLDARNGDKGNHVCRTDPGMNTLLPGEVDQIYRFADPANRGLDNCRRFSGKGHNGSIVIGIHRPVQQVHPLHSHRSHDRLDPPNISAL
jgi:hypothetical protein